MQQHQYSIEIKAPREKVWNTLWDDKAFRDWSGNIDPGMYYVGTIEEGSEVQFVSGQPGYGVTSVVEKLIPNEFVLFRHLSDTIDGSDKERDPEWTGGTEAYSLAETDGITTLTLITDVPPTQEETMKVVLPKALARVKELVENGK